MSNALATPRTFSAMPALPQDFYRQLDRGLRRMATVLQKATHGSIEVVGSSDDRVWLSLENVLQLGSRLKHEATEYAQYVAGSTQQTMGDYFPLAEAVTDLECCCNPHRIQFDGLDRFVSSALEWGELPVDAAVALTAIQRAQDVLLEAFGWEGVGVGGACEVRLAPLQPTVGAVSDLQRRRKCWARDHVWAEFDAGKNDWAAARDWGNGLTKDERLALAPLAAEPVGSGKTGYDSVRKGIEKARSEGAVASKAD